MSVWIDFIGVYLVDIVERQIAVHGIFLFEVRQEKGRMAANLKRHDAFAAGILHPEFLDDFVAAQLEDDFQAEAIGKHLARIFVVGGHKFQNAVAFGA